MSLLSRFVNGSLVSSERLMRARECYAPSRLTTGTVEAFDYWTEGASVQSELACARELAGMPDTVLQALAEEFNRCQNRPAPGWVRVANIVGLVLLGIGLGGLGGQGLADGSSRERLAMQLMSMLLGAHRAASIGDGYHDRTSTSRLRGVRDCAARFRSRPGAASSSLAEAENLCLLRAHRCWRLALHFGNARLQLALHGRVVGPATRKFG
jgi:hypothetical protein